MDQGYRSYHNIETTIINHQTTINIHQLSSSTSVALVDRPSGLEPSKVTAKLYTRLAWQRRINWLLWCIMVYLAIRFATNVATSFDTVSVYLGRNMEVLKFGIGAK